MIKQRVKSFLHGLGYEVHKIKAPRFANESFLPADAPPVEPVWPLPRRTGGPSATEIRSIFEEFDLCHYAYRFEGNLAFAARHNNPGPWADEPDRPLQRFRHFMPYLVEACEGTLAGKRILDIACNSGFWSIQCALLGADVLGFDARPDLIDQARLVKSIVGVDNVEFRVLDFWDMTPEALGGEFDIVLSLGILYHLPRPLEALDMTRSMSREYVLLDTSLYPSFNPVIRLAWEEPTDIHKASHPGVVALPSKPAVELYLRHLGISRWQEIPLRSADMPDDYLKHNRASWLIRV